MKILSLFDGMACGMIAMKLAGVDVESYDAYEIDKYAVKTAQHNFPMIREHGDVFTADFTQYEGVDFLVGGSPCTYWSIAQTKNRETVASGMGWELFSQYVRALREAKPKYFIYENNKSMSKQIRASIGEAFGFEAVLINSALVSAQNRQRLYWVGKRNADGTYSKVNVEQPEDRGILLKDVLDSAVAMREKGHAVIASAGRTTEREYFTKNQGNMVAEPINCTADRKAKTVSASYAYKGDGEGSLKSELFPDNPIKQTSNYVGYAIEFDENGKPIKAIGKDGKQITVYEVSNGQITIKGKQYSIKLKDGYYIIRKLTVTECKRLQTVPEWYDFSCVSNSQAYKMLGNGWTCEVIAHLIRACICPAEEKLKRKYPDGFDPERSRNR
jgi:DNA (cytosine-5)-methyltransferase 3A